jgi:hypothetical protein
VVFAVAALLYIFLFGDTSTDVSVVLLYIFLFGDASTDISVVLLY